MMTVTSNPNKSQWSLENGYINRPSETEYPFRIFHSKQYSGLFMSLRVFKPDLEYLCNLASGTYKISYRCLAKHFYVKLSKLLSLNSLR